MSEKKVILYSQPTCPPCHQAKVWLADHGIPMEERNIRERDEYLEELINLGASATPALVLGDQVIMGFQPDKLQEAWESYSKSE